MNISVHDNQLVSYCVLCDMQEIRLHTVFADREPHEYTDVVFTGVVAYQFEHDNCGNVIFDLVETDVLAIYAGNREKFEAGQKYAWPGAWNTSEEAALEFFISSSVRGFVLSSSYGMTGWVLAHSMSKIASSAALSSMEGN